MKTRALLLIACLFFFGCKNENKSSNDTVEETAQQVGDVMASIDEAGGSTGSISRLDTSIQKTFARYSPHDIENPNPLTAFFIPKAEATSCAAGAGGFGSCNANIKHRTFGGCTVGSAVMSGDVTLTWGGSSANCTLGTNPGNTITRVPSYSVTGLHDAVLSVSKTGTVGQRLTLTGSSPMTFLFTNDGIKRKFTTSNNTVIFDQTSSVTSAMTITGADRNSRVLSGGSLRVTDNLNSTTCDFSPTNVTWNTASCNCPTQGSWSGTCSDGSTTTLQITGCGTATFTKDSTTTNVSFDRCGT
ncbi:MAG: hypothetical protein ACXVAX_06230 [Pseudobdellovibrio sp.]